ncbi:MAG: hypothetical protein LBO06_01240 [Bacteroidales bacterium]|jgi:hypothetical protein|nr:hypothetical protein [Bacteroidales bacterium]
MKRLLSILIVALQFSSLSAQNQQQTSWEQAALKAKVKSVREITYSALENEAKVIRGDVKAGAKNTLIRYNSKGYQTELVNYKPDGKLEWRYTSDYDNENKLTEEKTYNSADSLILKAVYNYQDGKISQGYCYKADNSLFEFWLYTYDVKGNLIKQVGYANTNIFTTWLFAYDEHNRLISKNIYNPHDSLIFTWTCHFEPNGERYEEQDNQPLVKQVNRFNSSGLCVESTLHYDQNITGSKDIFEYSYDSKGNWIECVSYHDDMPILIAKRTIEYYQ